MIPVEESATPVKAVKVKVEVSEDLSQEILRTVKKRPGDIVRCTRVGANNYRCNWWQAEELESYDNPSMGGMLVTTHRVRESRFLSVTRTGESLSIRDVTSGGSSGREMPDER